MTIYRLILPAWAENGKLRRVLEGQFSWEEIEKYNGSGYNCYYLPNHPSSYERGQTVEGSQVDTFRYVFVDFDLKSGTYRDKDSFIAALSEGPLPSRIVDSGGGVHAYWAVSDLDATSYLKLSRRLMRKFNTDPAVGQVYQLMRVPGTVNTKDPDNLRLCEEVYTSEARYTCEQLDASLPPLRVEDAEHCQQHYDKTYGLLPAVEVDDRIPLKFAHLVKSNKEVKEIWAGGADDRSKGDYRLGHILFANGFTRAEATSVLVNSSKALARAPQHRVNYAVNIIDKIWTFEKEPEKAKSSLSYSVRDILSKNVDSLKGTRFPCYRYLDNTEHGFRLGQVIGLVAGSGVGKTAIALNMFMGFVRNNPDYDHFFIPLEQPAHEIADRWRKLCGEDERLHDKVHVISNYAEDGSFRHLSFDEIKDYLLEFQKETGRKVGCVVIDHIGALKKKGRQGENQDLMDICHQMKAFAVHTNTLLIMQSQAPREKAGIGDLELSKDAAYGTVFFEAYCDYLITMHQPLKRCYPEGAPTVTAFKFCKIRHKNQVLDEIKEDVCYALYFDSATGHLRELTEVEEKSFEYFNQQATNKRKQDRKTDLVVYTSARTGQGAAS